MKKVLLGLFLALTILLSVSVPVLAADPNITTVVWSGAGSVSGSVASGNDATTSFGTGGTYIDGNLTVTDNNDNPYSYGVDTVRSYMVSAVTNGSTYYQTVRQDSKISSYGHSGQVAYAFASVESGTAELAFGGSTNYAAMVNCTYAQPKTSSGKNLEASGVNYFLQQFIAANAVDTGSGWAATDNFAVMTATGTGTALIDCMTTESSGDAYRGGQTRLGWGGGCYTNADAAFTGIGTFQLSAVGTNSIASPVADASGNLAPGAWTVPGDGSFGSCSYSVVANFVGNFVIPNYSVTAR